MSGRDAIRMSDVEVDAFLRGARKVQVATVNPDGTAHLTTLFHVVRDGRLAFWTYGRSQKIRNLERDPRITCLVEDGDDYSALRGVSITGTAELLREYDDVLALGSQLAMRMFDVEDRGLLGELGTAEVERQARKRVGVVVTPDRVASWDHSKMLGAATGGQDREEGARSLTR
jgi:PPOX class probable F420-dependent enzyme